MDLELTARVCILDPAAGMRLGFSAGVLDLARFEVSGVVLVYSTQHGFRL